MERMYQEYADLAEFYLVYIVERHDPDDAGASAGAKKNEHHEQFTEKEGGMVARRLIRDKKLTFACLIDGPNAAGARAW